MARLLHIFSDQAPGTLIVVASALLLGRAAGAQARTLPVRDVQLAVAVDSAGRASVREDYTLSSAVRDVRFQYLAALCADLGPITLTARGATITLHSPSSTHGAWIALAAELPAIGADTLLSWSIVYTVRLSGREVSIPIVMPAMAIGSAEDFRDGIADVQVTLPRAPPAARVLMPQLQPLDEAGRWSAGFLALPSLIRVHLGEPLRTEPCADASRAAARGDSGTFEPVFWSFVGVMALWIPLYLAWAYRRRDRSS